MSEINIKMENKCVRVYKDEELIPGITRINFMIGDKLYDGFDLCTDKTSRRCVILANGKALDGQIVNVESDEIFGPNTERNVQGDLIIDEVHKISRYTIEVVE